LLAEAPVVALIGHLLGRRRRNVRERRHRSDRVVRALARRRDGDAIVEWRAAIRRERIELLRNDREVLRKVRLLLGHRSRVIDDEKDVHLLARLRLRAAAVALVDTRALREAAVDRRGDRRSIRRAARDAHERKETGRNHTRKRSSHHASH